MTRLHMRYSSLILALLVVFSLPGSALEVSVGRSATYYYSRNVAAGGYPREYSLEFPLLPKVYGRLSYLSFDYYGQLDGLRFTCEKVLWGEGRTWFSLRGGIFYTGYWGSPVVLVKNSYLDQLPTYFQEVGISLRPIIFSNNRVSFSLFGIFLSADPISFTKFNYGLSLYSMGYTL